MLDLPVQALKDCNAELAVAVDGHHSGMRKSLVHLELDAVLRIDQIQLQLVRPVEHAHAQNRRMQGRRLAGARKAHHDGATGNVLGREIQRCDVLSTALAQRRNSALRRCRTPPTVRLMFVELASALETRYGITTSDGDHAVDQRDEPVQGDCLIAERP